MILFQDNYRDAAFDHQAYQIAIPSYRRPLGLVSKTLQTLLRNGIGMERVTIFVANPSEHNEYSEAIRATVSTAGQDDLALCNIVIAEPGMRAVRNFIRGYYAEGVALLMLDDDIEDIRQRVDDQTAEPFPAGTLDLFIEQAFLVAKTEGVHLWGIYPVKNPFFQSDKLRRGLSYINGAMWGLWNTHDRRTLTALDDKEDFERSVRFYLLDGSVHRYEYVSTVTRYYDNPGGMSEGRQANPGRIAASARRLVRMFPNLVHYDSSKSSGKAEVKLKDTRPSKS